MNPLESRREQPTKNSTPIQERYRVTEEHLSLLEQIVTKSARSRSAAKKLIGSGRVTIDGTPTTLATEVPRAGALIAVHRGTPPAPFRHPKLELIWENEAYVILYKKSGIPTVNTSHKDRLETAIWVVSQYYKAQDPESKLFMTNRLDRNTAGFIIFAKSVEAKEALVRHWKERVREQRFIACVEGEVPETSFTITATSDEAAKVQWHSSAEVTLRKSNKAGTLHIVEVSVRDARIFSLRKMLADNGLAIFGDVRSRSQYQTRSLIALEQIGMSLQIGGRELTFERPYPTHYFQLLRN